MPTRSTTAALAVLALVAAATSASAQTQLYAASSKAQGAPFDLVVTEVRREANRSYLAVPGFHSRSAPGARWLMCAYTDLAIKRGFSHWSVMYPEQDKEILVVAFSNSSTTSPKSLFAEEFNKDRVVGEQMASVEKFVSFCGIRR